MGVINTKIVHSLPQNTDLEKSTQYLVSTDDGKFEQYVTDNNKVPRIIKTGIINPNLLRYSAVYNNLQTQNVAGNPAGYITVRLWDATPVVYGLWNSASGKELWGVRSKGVDFSTNKFLFTKDVSNKLITVSVDVKSKNKRVKIGLNVAPNTEMPFKATPNEWTRIHLTYSGTALAGIYAQLDEAVTTTHTALTETIYFKDWKVEEGNTPTDWIPCWSDLGESQVSYVKTYQLLTPNNFSTNQYVENVPQDNRSIGLTQTNTTLNVSYTQYTFNCKYIFLVDNSTLTVNHRLSAGTTFHSSEDNNENIFKGNRGDYVQVEFYQDNFNRIMCTAQLVKLRGLSDKVIPVTANLVLNDTHAGRILQFNNTSNITVTITNLPAGSTLSGVKNTGNGNVTFIGTTAPTTDNVLNNITNSSFSLIKNATGISNLLINNK